MNKAAVVVILLVVITVACFSVVDTATAGGRLPPAVAAQKRTLVCGSCGYVLETTLGWIWKEQMKRGRTKCPKCGAVPLYFPVKCPGCGAIVPAPRPVEPWETRLPPDERRSYKCPKCGRELLDFSG